METRQIKISLDTAKRLYEQGGEYRDIALTAFKEHELIGDRLPKTWQEFCYSNDRKPNEAFISNGSEINCITEQHERKFYQDRNLLPSKQAAEQHLAYMQLHQLRDCYRQGWIPDLIDESRKYCIVGYYSSITKSIRYQVVDSTYASNFLSFPTNELANEFLTNFQELIEQAGDLI